MLHRGDEVRVLLETKDAPFQFHGKFVEADEDALMLKGTVGDYIGKEIIVPQNRIKAIEVVERVSDKRLAYDETWRDDATFR